MTLLFPLVDHQPARERVPFLGVRFDPIDEAEALAELLARDPNEDFAAVVTPNSDHLVRIDRLGGEVAHAYDVAWLCLNDSRTVRLLGKFVGLDLPTVPGANLVRDLFSAPGFDPAWPVLFVGSTPAVFETIVRGFKLKNAIHFDAPMGLLRDRRKFDDTVAFIEAHPARFILLAVGSPQQELLAQRLKARGKAKGIGLCIGAAMEFLAYPQRRAPDWISKIGMEWLFRLLREPRRLWRRYLVDSPQIVRLVFRNRLNRGK